jgi:hypothetical protein
VDSTAEYACAVGMQALMVIALVGMLAVGHVDWLCARGAGLEM